MVSFLETLYDRRIEYFGVSRSLLAIRSLALEADRTVRLLLRVASLFVVLLPSPPSQASEAGERDEREPSYEERVSLEIMEGSEAWQEPGFTLHIGPLVRRPVALKNSPDFSGVALAIRPSIRVDKFWSVGLNLTYGSWTSASYNGARWTTTLEPTLHLGDAARLVLGVGYGGFWINESKSANSTDDTFENEDTTTPTHDAGVGAKPASCFGSGIVGLLRGEYLYAVGTLFATGPFAQADTQWTQCEKRFNTTDLETGQPRSRRTSWQTVSIALGWWLAWR